MKERSATPFTEMASGFRTRIVKQWAMKQTGSPSVTASQLTGLACELGLVNRERSVPGTALAEWARTGETPLWAAQAAFSAELKFGWRPVSPEDWAGFASLHFKIYKSMELDMLLSELPDDMDKIVAAGWLAAAVEEDRHFRTKKKLILRNA